MLYQELKFVNLMKKEYLHLEKILTTLLNVLIMSIVFLKAICTYIIVIFEKRFDFI